MFLLPIVACTRYELGLHHFNIPCLLNDGFVVRLGLSLRSTVFVVQTIHSIIDSFDKGLLSSFKINPNRATGIFILVLMCVGNQRNKYNPLGVLVISASFL